MIQQPDLGKKIADLRKAKGLTQEELVDKCNLNVRTLQRIESGEVTPRTYTIRLIFEALDYSLEESIIDKGLINKWLEQFYISFIDLFNLKTNTMKKISILTVVVTLIVFGITTINSEIKAQRVENKQVEKEKPKRDNSHQREMVFSNFSCEGCFEENGLMIGRDVKFDYIGTKVDVRLIAINKQTREFNVGFTKGIFMEHRVEISIAEDMLVNDLVTYSAEKVEKSDDNIFLKGKAKVTYQYDDKIGTIETDEILISLK